MSGRLREPLWFCHECHSEMRPLMVPDPVCASCRSDFVEKMENPSDDPRQFAHDVEDDYTGADGAEQGMPLDALLLTLQSMMDRGMPRNGLPRANTGPAVTFEIRGPNGSRTVRVGGSTTMGGAAMGPTGMRPDTPNAVPNMSTFLGPNPPNGRDRPDISGPLMAQYLMALLGQHDLPIFGAMPESGRMGDYVFNQEALDNIITQIMENSNAHRPVPATEEIIAKLSREVLMEGSKTLQEDCAVCKEQFNLETEDPDEQIVVTLPCKHPFHEPCIIPWLKSSGTCPVCRYALIPQPDQHPTANQPPIPDPTHNNSPPNRSSSPPSQNSGGSGPARGPEHNSPGLLQSIFGGLAHLAHGTQPHRTTPSTSSGNRSGARSPPPPTNTTNTRHDSQHRRSNSDPAFSSSSLPESNRRQNNDHGNDNVPGSWAEDLD